MITYFRVQDAKFHPVDELTMNHMVDFGLKRNQFNNKMIRETSLDLWLEPQTDDLPAHGNNQAFKILPPIPFCYPKNPPIVPYPLATLKCSYA